MRKTENERRMRKRRGEKGERVSLGKWYSAWQKH